MFDSIVLDIVIGLVFVYLLYSLLVTIIQEIIANMLSFRAKFLEKAIIRMLDDEKVTQNTTLNSTLDNYISIIPESLKIESNFSHHFYSHPLIKCLREQPGASKPSYLINKTFSKVLIDLLKGEVINPGQDIRPLIQEALNSGKFKWRNDTSSNLIKDETLAYLRSIWVDAQGDVERFKELIENWFDETMNRTSEWYKKYAQFISLIIAFIIAVCFNVDTINIVQKLEKDPELRELIVNRADQFIKEHPNLKEEYANKINNELKVIDTLNNISENVKDTLKADVKLKYEKEFAALKSEQDSLYARAQRILKNDVNNVNNLLAIGLNSFSFEKCAKFHHCQKLACQIKLIFRSLIGWILTALALSMGAPFWFDLLNKLMKLRNSVQNSALEEKLNLKDQQVSKIKRVG